MDGYDRLPTTNGIDIRAELQEDQDGGAENTIRRGMAGGRICMGYVTHGPRRWRMGKVEGSKVGEEGRMKKVDKCAPRLLIGGECVNVGLEGDWAHGKKNSHPRSKAQRAA